MGHGLVFNMRKNGDFKNVDLEQIMWFFLDPICKKFRLQRDKSIAVLIQTDFIFYLDHKLKKWARIYFTEKATTRRDFWSSVGRESLRDFLFCLGIFSIIVIK